MFRIHTALAIAGLLCLFLPQTASAAPTLEWDGRAELMSGQLGLSPDVLPNGAQGDKVARNIGRGISGGLYLGVGIPIVIVGGVLTGIAIYFFATADAALAIDPETNQGVALASRIGGLIFLVLAISAFSSGFSLVAKGVKALSKISDASLTGPDPRMARAEKNRARWGLQFAVAGAPIRR